MSGTAEEVQRLIELLDGYESSTSNAAKIPFIENIIDLMAMLFVNGDFKLSTSFGEETEEYEVAKEYVGFLEQKYIWFMKSLWKDITQTSSSDLFFSDKITKKLLKLANAENSYSNEKSLLFQIPASSFQNAIQSCLNDELDESFSFDERKRRISLEILMFLTCWSCFHTVSENSLFLQLINEKVDVKLGVITSISYLILLKEARDEEVELPFYFKPLMECSNNSFLNKVIKFMNSIKLKKYSADEIKESALYLVMKAPKIKAKTINDVSAKVWLKLSSTSLLSASTRLRLISAVTTNVIPNIKHPLLFSDFYTNCFKTSLSEQDPLIPINSLEGLFILITEHGLDYPDFYKRLYELAGCSLDTSNPNTVSKFFRLIDSCLSSEFVAGNLVASFAKILARKTLTAAPNVIVLSCVLIHNILTRHKSCIELIHREAKAEAKAKSSASAETQLSEEYAKRHSNAQKIRERTMKLAEELNKIQKSSETNFERSIEDIVGEKVVDISRITDPFDASESDPLKTKAEDSCLWELELLKNHFSASVRSVVRNVVFKAFEKALRTRKFEPIIDIDRFSGMNFNSLFERDLNLKRKIDDEAEQPNKKSNLEIPLNVFRGEEELSARIAKEVSSIITI